MDLVKELKEAQDKQQKAANNLNNLRRQFQQQEQALLQEILRTDGEVRLLQRLANNVKKGK